MPTTAHEVILGYARLGYRLFPIRPGTKRPIFKGWSEQASSDEDTILNWWKRWPACNWAITIGSGFSVLDLDPVALEAGWPGEERRKDLKATNCPLARTPRLGFHLYFRADWPNSTGKVAPGVDTKGRGGYIVVPPSALEASAYKDLTVLIHGGVYRWIRPLLAIDHLPAPPQWLDELVKAAPRQAEQRTAEAAALADKALRDCEILPEGQRNNGLTRLAGKLRRLGLSQPELEAALLEANRVRCHPPLPEREVLAIARSVSRYPAGSPQARPVFDPIMAAAWREAMTQRRWKTLRRRKR